jgi:hypothetical protein
MSVWFAAEDIPTVPEKALAAGCDVEGKTVRPRDGAIEEVPVEHLRPGTAAQII